MSGKPVRLAAAAAADLREIRRYTIEQWGHGQWLRYSEELDALFEQLSGNPALGPARDEIRLGLRSFPVGAHVIWYRLRANHPEVVRILHAAMNRKTRL